MLIQHKQLIGLDVETQSGEVLGKIAGLLINVDTHEIEQYEVSPSLVKQFLGEILLINRKQVKEIKKDKVVVEDGVVKEYKFQPAIDV